MQGSGKHQAFIDRMVTAGVVPEAWAEQFKDQRVEDLLRTTAAQQTVQPLIPADADELQSIALSRRELGPAFRKEALFIAKTMPDVQNGPDGVTPEAVIQKLASTQRLELQLTGRAGRKNAPSTKV